MTAETPQSPEFAGRPFYGYDSAQVQQGYAARTANSEAGFLLPRLAAGMTILDCGCGPGSITLGLAELVSPGRAVGIDLEPTMIEQASSLASETDIGNVEFRVADIYDLPFADAEFDAVFSSSVTEHLSDPVGALREVRRVIKRGGIAGIVRTEWSFPFIVPESESVSRFFELFEGGFNRYGGSLNRGRFLRSDMREAGFEVVEFEARASNNTDTESVSRGMEGFIAWIDNLPLFQESIALGLTSEEELDSVRRGMREWAEHPDAYYSTAAVRAVGMKN